MRLGKSCDSLRAIGDRRYRAIGDRKLVLSGTEYGLFSSKVSDLRCP